MTLNNTVTLPLALTAYGLPHVMGYLPTKAGQPHPNPLGPIGLMDAAQEFGLAGVEIPLTTRVPSFEGRTVEVEAPGADPSAGSGQALREALDARHLKVVADYGVVVEHDAQHLRDYLRTAARVGAKVVRATLSSILCGDRRTLAGGWEARLEAVAKRLNEVLPYAEDCGSCLALENHQDATTDDLLRLAEMVDYSPAYGITLDTGNPLAVGEEPVEAARRMGPLIRHVHLKDYTIHFAPEGYRLARCVAGDGVIDFPAILEIVRQNGHDVLPGIEMAAQATRTIPLLEPDWWACYPAVPATNILPVLRLLWEKGRPAHAPYSSVWERGEDSAAVSAEEWDVARRSVEYFRQIKR